MIEKQQWFSGSVPEFYGDGLPFLSVADWPTKFIKSGRRETEVRRTYLQTRQQTA
jgi:hypothetical protein